MKKIILTILTTALLLIGLTPIAAFCDEQPEASMYLWRLINEARVHPLRTIESLEIDEEAARLALGEDAWMLDQGLPPVAWNEALFQAAAGHNRDMVEQLYYSSTDLDGGTVVDRVGAQGYEAVDASELLGVMAFDAVIAPLEAARLLFENWLMDELNPANTAARHIFSRDFTEAGFSFNAAVLDLGADLPHNVYVAVIDLARPQTQRVYMMGNVYQDANQDGLWEPAEGWEGVDVVTEDVIRGGTETFVSGVQGFYQVAIPGLYFTIDVLDGERQLSSSSILNGTILGRSSNSWLDFCLW